MTAIRLFAALFAFACVYASAVTKKKAPEPSFIALAKRKAQVGQDSGVAGLFKKEGDLEDRPGTKVVDLFQLVMSEQRGEARETLFAREEVRKSNHYGKLPRQEVARLNDKTYRAAFKTALKKVVTTTSIILHANAKTALLSMEAARLGAYRVYAVEGDEVLADIARKVVAANGYSDRITVIHKNLTDLTHKDLPFKVDIFVNERVTSNLLTSLLPHESAFAMETFVKEGGVAIPRVGRLSMFAIESVEERKGIRVVGPVAGFDFSRLNRLAPTVQTKPIDLNKVHYRAISEMTPNYMWRLEEPEETLPHYHQSTVVVISAGILDSFVFYWDLWLDDQVKLTTNPMMGTPHAGFLQQIICNVTPRYVNSGDKLTLLIGMNMGLLQADIIKINGETIIPTEVHTSSQAI